MSVAGLADRTVTFLRRSSVIVAEAVAAATMTIAAQPVRAACMKVTVADGQTGSGTVTTTGTVGGSSDSEVLTFAANGVKLGVKQFTAITSIATSGLSSETPTPTVAVQAVDTAGAPQHAEATIAATVPVTVYEAGRGRGFPVDQQGSGRDEMATVYLAWTEAFTPRDGDIIQDDTTGDRWFIDMVRLFRSRTIPHHYELDVHRD